MNNILKTPDNRKYSGMFLISTDKKESPLEKSVEINGMHICFSKTANLISVIGKDNEQIGFLIGIVVDYKNNKIITKEIILTIDNDDYINSIESQIYMFSGSWAFILCDKNHRRLYLDSCGSYSAVYDTSNKSTASITGLLLNDEDFIERFDGDLHTELEVNNFGWLPAGLTAHKGVKRLICNHYLDLTTYKSIRHWPKQEFVCNKNVELISKKIAQIIQATVHSLSDDGKTCLTLTGGKDSRLILSSVKKFKSKVELATINLPGSELDVYLATKIASSDKNLKHTIYPPVKASTNRRIEWLYNASYCVGGVNQYYSPSIRPLSKFKYLVGGAAGEIGRAFLWHDSDTRDMPITASLLISRLGLKYNYKVEEKIEEWLSDLQSYDAFTILDLAYAELRVSPWAFAQSYSYEGREKLTQISPFVNRELITLLFSLPAKARRNEEYVYEGVNYLWPELLQIQFNKYNDYRDYIQKIKRLFIPGVLISKLRKVFAIK